MIKVRSSVEELKYLFSAAMLLDDRAIGATGSRDLRRRHKATLASLAQFKSLNVAADAPADVRPTNYQAILTSTYKHYNQVSYDGGTSSHDIKSGRIRTEGKYIRNEKTRSDVWIEWKTYKEERVPHQVRSREASYLLPCGSGSFTFPVCLD